MLASQPVEAWPHVDEIFELETIKIQFASTLSVFDGCKLYSLLFIQ
jgi:hypothetical protein